MENMNHNSLAPLCEHNHIIDANRGRGRGRNCAFVTILTDYNDEGSIKSIVALAKSLTKANTIFPLLVLVWPHHPSEVRERLRSQGCIVKELVPLFHHASDDSAFHNINYSKIHIWKLVEYEKMVYLDPGMLVLANIDNLFYLPNGRIYAVMDCLCNTPGMMLCPYNDKILPYLVPGVHTYFNHKMLVFEPDIITFHGLLNALLFNKPNSFVEQDILNKYFAKKCEPISIRYNYDMEMLSLHPQTHTDHVNAKVVHFRTEDSKPWGALGVQLKQWWDILEDDTLEFHHPQNLERLMQSIMDASVTDDADRDGDSSTILHAPPAA